MNESTLSTLLHRACDNLDPESSQVDLGKAVQEGRRRQWRTRATVSAAVSVVTAAAVATMVILPASSSPSKTAPLAGSTQTAASPVSYTLTADTDVTVADVLTEAAHGVQASQSTRTTPGDQAADVPLVNGWPHATYWHTLTQWTDSACPGQVVNSNSWLSQDVSLVAENKLVGPKSVNQTMGCSGGVTQGAYPVMDNPAGVLLGGKTYTWSQWAALPTDPAKLWPIVPLTLEVPANFDWTVVIDTSNGQLLAQLTGAPPSRRAASA